MGCTHASAWIRTQAITERNTRGGFRWPGVEAPQEEEQEEEHEHDDHECGDDHEAEQEHELGAPLARQLGMEQRFLEVRAGAGGVSCGEQPNQQGPL